MFKNLILAFILVVIYPNPVLELLALFFMELGHGALIWFVAPHSNKNIRLMAFADEVIAVIIVILIAILQIMNIHDTSYESKYVIGWVIIGCCISGVMMAVVFILIEAWTSLKIRWKRKKVKSIKKIYIRSSMEEKWNVEAIKCWKRLRI